jgi:predicted dehydrogenase
MKRRVGIIGVRFGAQVHVPGFRSEGWDVAAICSRNGGRPKAAADSGIAGIYTDPLELIDRDDIEAVAIITPPGAHHDLSIAALNASKHVLCESHSPSTSGRPLRCAMPPRNRG